MKGVQVTPRSTVVAVLLHIALLVLLLFLISCTSQAPEPPALPEDPTLLDGYEPPNMATASLECAVIAELPGTQLDYRRTKQGRRKPSQPDSVEATPRVRPTPRPQATTQVIAQGMKEAEVYPTSAGYVGKQALYRFRWEPGKIYVIPTHPSTATRLYFPRGERVVTQVLLNTDKENGWEYISGPVGSEGYEQDVYAFRPLTETTPAVTTGVDLESGRSIYFRLVVGKAPMLAVTWDVRPIESPDEERVRSQNANAEREQPCPGSGMLMPIELAQLHTGYKIEAKGPVGFLPTQVFDDGRKTFIKFRPLGGNMPTVFTYKASGERGLVYFTPYRVPNDPSRGLWYVIDQIWPKIELVGTDGQAVLLLRLSDTPAVAVADHAGARQ
jgi:hypothetical protein